MLHGSCEQIKIPEFLKITAKILENLAGVDHIVHHGMIGIRNCLHSLTLYQHLFILSLSSISAIYACNERNFAFLTYLISCCVHCARLLMSDLFRQVLHQNAHLSELAFYIIDLPAFLKLQECINKFNV